MRMRKKMFWCLVLTALCLTSFAQHEEIKVIGADTFATVKVERLREANAKDVELRQCNEVSDSLSSQVRSYTGMTNNLRAAILDLKIANQLNQKLLSDKDDIIIIQDKQIVRNERQIKWLKLQRWAFIAGIVLLTGKIIL